MENKKEKPAQTCKKCEEQIEICDGCGTAGCPECNDYETPYRDDATIFMCPQCAKEVREEWARERAEAKTGYESAANEYLRLFCEKHEYDFEDAKRSWVAGDVGTIANVGDEFVDMVTIRADIDQNVPEDEFIKWYDYCLRIASIDHSIPTPNYDSWLRGCPRRTEEEIQKLEEMQQKVGEARLALENAINESEF